MCTSFCNGDAVELVRDAEDAAGGEVDGDVLWCLQEISLDLFLQVYWEDPRVHICCNHSVVELTWTQQQPKFWVPDLYIRQLREMKVLSLFQEMTSVRLYSNSTMRVSIGATVIIKCDMDFVLYPLDIQKCAVDFSSYKYTMEAMKFKWKDDPPLSFPSDFGDDGYRLAKYVVSFSTEKNMQVIFYGEGNHSTARMLITMSREIRSHLLESYLPSTLFVIMSWGSFVVIPEIVPGRMVLLVTTLLSLVTMFDTVRNNSPNALELKCIEVWLISCTLFVFFALLEYFVVLFGIRYDKHWRHKKRDLERQQQLQQQQQQQAQQIQQIAQVWAGDRVKLPPLAHHRRSGSNSTASMAANNIGMSSLTEAPPPAPAAATPSPRLLQGSSKVSPHADLPRHRPDKHEPGLPAGDSADSDGPRRRFRMVAEYVILYCGSQRGMLDQVSLALFPFCFILFTTVYWISYVSESQRQRNSSN
ncbi:Gamma-aminobutyric acid receptor subunit beta [Frankliniella fusca]|uniref:Gamma-aminobutyric acid receptor subunit beta n=1 Tax=Frankliniella fusca TaxID=407009 RepID=A0AAE1I143_9NEOP|nr:Gamma-aminobutyric acid receptor subunit beta [Frankliniella fusca]